MDIDFPTGIFDLGDTLKDHGTLPTFLFVVSLVLIFLVGYALRDALQKRGMRLRSAKTFEGPRRG
jgi:hypothetical protein